MSYAEHDTASTLLRARPFQSAPSGCHLSPRKHRIRDSQETKNQFGSNLFFH